ncbi:MAG: hypothetical protein BWY75_01933 [bacterium ADurb.Bin425]|nr:MAG: hypothetical protein BWY75_01933 [bacterium ADurb.Bin425]
MTKLLSKRFQLGKHGLKIRLTVEDDFGSTLDPYYSSSARRKHLPDAKQLLPFINQAMCVANIAQIL